MNPCKHCGEPSKDSDFCCSGCATAYAILESADLKNFYRQGIGNKPRSSDEVYEVFDHPEFLAAYTTPNENGDLEASFSISGIHCPACVWLLEQLPRLVDSCIESRVSFGKSQIFLRWQSGPQSLSQIAKKLTQLGYSIQSPQRENSFEKKEFIRIGITGFSSMATMHMGLFFLAGHYHPIESNDVTILGAFSALISAPAIFYGGWPFIKNTWQSLKLFQLNPDALIAFGILIGYLYSLYNVSRGDVTSYFDAMSMVVFFLLCGRMIVRRATQFSIQPPFFSALKWQNEKWESVPANTIQIGDRIRIDTDDSIVVDAVLLSNQAQLDLNAVTGESDPQTKIVSDQITQFSRNIGAPIEVQALKSFSESSAQKALESSAVRSAPKNSQRLIQIFTIFILGLATLPFFLELTDPILKSVAVLIVSCPCALLLAEPLGLSFVRSWLLSKGVGVLNIHRLWNLISVRNIYFDKTGTLTEDEMKLTDKIKIDEINRENYSVLFEMTLRSQHPLSQSLRHELIKYSLKPVSLDDFEEVPGVGLKAKHLGRDFELIASRNSKSFACEFFKDGKSLNVFEFQSSWRPELAETFRILKSMGLKLVVLSGDRSVRVEELSRSFSKFLKKVIGGLSPDQKAKEIQGESIYVGDGLNDFAALSKANFGVGLKGSAESQFGAADAYLMKKNLLLIPLLIEAAKTAWRRLQWNYIISFAYNIISILLIFSGAIGPVLCAIFMPLSSLSVLVLARWPYPEAKNKPSLPPTSALQNIRSQFSEM